MIERSSVYHRPTDQFAYIGEKEILYLLLRSKRSDLSNVTLIYGDQYEWDNEKWITHTLPMKKTGYDQLFDYWFCKVKPPYHRLRYGFLLNKEDEEITLIEKGFFSSPPEDPNGYFCFPYLHLSAQFQIPNWVYQTVWYQIFVDRFANGNPTINHPLTKPWGSEEPTTSSIFGGDLQGIIEKLDYLTTLGINGIYLTPIFKATSNHKYDTIDYFEIDPHFGDKETLKHLVQLCHKKGIRVMLDAVFNHCGYYFPPFQDVLKNGPSSPYFDWFHVHDYPIIGGPDHSYETFSFEKTMPKLNIGNPEVKKYLFEVSKYWIKEFDIDGWRLDVANEVDPSFWREFRQTVKSVKEDIFILGEVWHDAIPWLRGEQFDSVMNYPLQMNVLKMFANEGMLPKEFQQEMIRILHMYPYSVNKGLFNIIGSHDTPRISTECQGCINKIKLAFIFLFTFIGTPCIYYGDEIGLTGSRDPGCRKCMEWDPPKQNKELFSFIQKLITLRKQEPLLTNSGDLCFLQQDNPVQCIAYTKSLDQQTILILLNPTADTVDFPLSFSLKGKKIINLWRQEEYALESDNLILPLNEYSFEILKF